MNVLKTEIVLCVDLQSNIAVNLMEMYLFEIEVDKRFSIILQIEMILRIILFQFMAVLSKLL